MEEKGGNGGFGGQEWWQVGKWDGEGFQLVRGEKGERELGAERERERE